MDPLPAVSPATLPAPSELDVVWREAGAGYLVPNDAANGAIAYTTDGELRLVDPDGTVRWSWMGEDALDVDIGQQVVAVEDVDGGVAVTGLDLRSGVERWTARLRLEPALAGLVDVVDEVVFIHALVRGPSSGEKDVQLWALDAGSGTPLWRMTGQMIGAGDSVVVVEQPRKPCRFVLLNAMTGEVHRPLEQIELGRVEQLGTGSAGSAIVDGLVVLATYSAGNGGVDVVASDVTSGEVRWRARPPWSDSYVWGRLAVAEHEGRVFISSLESSPDPTVTPELLLRLDAFDATSGEVLWSFEHSFEGDPEVLLGFNPTTFGQIFEAESTVAIPVGSSIVRLDPASGRMVAVEEIGGELGDEVAPNGLPNPPEVIVTPDGTALLGLSFVTWLR